MLGVLDGNLNKGVRGMDRISDACQTSVNGTLDTGGFTYNGFTNPSWVGLTFKYTAFG